MASSKVDDENSSKYLGLIFEYLTPVEWLQMSQVSQLWKDVASRQWEKITEIIYHEERWDKLERTKTVNRDEAPVISAQEAESIVICAAPFVKTLHGTSSSDVEQEKLVMFGPFWYRVENFIADNMFKLLAENATAITEVRFGTLPRVELLKQLFKKNTIKKLKVFGAKNSFHEDIITIHIEDLDVQFFFDHQTEFTSFQGYFPSLKKLKLGIFCMHQQKGVLSEILPFVRGLTSLSITTNYFKRRQQSFKFLRDIVKLVNLEELFLSIDETLMCQPLTDFLTDLETGCPKLRSLQLLGIRVNDDAFKTFRSLPKLEVLDIELEADFRSFYLLEMENLTELGVEFEEEETVNVSNLYSAIENMRKLIRIEIHNLNCRAALKLARRVSLMAASRKKDSILITHPYDEKSPKLKIERKVGDKDVKSSKKPESLKLLIALDDGKENKFFRLLQAYVNDHLEGYDVLDPWEM